MNEQATELKRAGNRLWAAKDYDGAKKAFSALVELEPHEPDGYLGLAKIFEMDNDYHSILHLIEPIVDRIKSAQLLKRLGDAYRVLVYRGQRQYVEPAIKFYEEYHLERKDPVTLFYLAEIYRERKKDYERALSLYRESWDHDLRSRPAYTGVLTCLKFLGRQQEIESIKELWKERYGAGSG